MKYYVRVGERDHELEIDGDSVTLNGALFRAHIEDLPGVPMQLVSIDGTIHRLIARRIELRNADELPLWCERFAESCAQLEKAIAARIAECQRASATCQLS